MKLEKILNLLSIKKFILLVIVVLIIAIGFIALTKNYKKTYEYNYILKDTDVEIPNDKMSLLELNRNYVFTRSDGKYIVNFKGIRFTEERASSDVSTNIYPIIYDSIKVTFTNI